MTLQNRVLPTGEVVAAPFRGTMFGNRGIIHDDNRQLKTSRWSHPHWVSCVLEYKNHHRTLMTPHRYTELFFLDECVALAVGHRPCGLCRRDDYLHWRATWAKAHGHNKLNDDDRMLHAARVTRTRQHRRHQAAIGTLPDGTFILHDDAPWLIWQDALIRYDQDTYTDKRSRPASGEVTVLTPAPTVATMAVGYKPRRHPSAS